MADNIQINTTGHSRFWVKDLLGTNAIAVMITFHTLYLLNYFRIHSTDLYLCGCPDFIGSSVFDQSGLTLAR